MFPTDYTQTERDIYATKPLGPSLVSPLTLNSDCLGTSRSTQGVVTRRGGTFELGWVVGDYDWNGIHPSIALSEAKERWGMGESRAPTS